MSISACYIMPGLSFFERCGKSQHNCTAEWPLMMDCEGQTTLEWCTPLHKVCYCLWQGREAAGHVDSYIHECENLSHTLYVCYSSMALVSSPPPSDLLKCSMPCPFLFSYFFALFLLICNIYIMEHAKCQSHCLSWLENSLSKRQGCYQWWQSKLCSESMHEEDDCFTGPTWLPVDDNRQQTTVIQWHLWKRQKPLSNNLPN